MKQNLQRNFTIFSKKQYLPQQFKIRKEGKFLYAIWLFHHFILCYRHHLHDYGTPLGHFANLWVCNVSLVLSSVGILWNFPDMVGYCIIAVSTGHIFWNLDTILMIVNRRHHGPFQVANYTTYKASKLWYRIWLNSHHMWFMPCSIIYLRSIPKFCLSTKHYVGAMILVMFLTGVTALLIPMQCVNTVFDDGQNSCLVINVNMVREWWGSNHLKILHIFDRTNGNGPFFYFIYANLLYSVVMNRLWFLLMKKLFRV